MKEDISLLIGVRGILLIGVRGINLATLEAQY